jgi:hypothetical protein
LAVEGYIQGVDGPAPSVISLNSTVSSLAVTAALNMAVNLTGGGNVVDQIYDAKTGSVFTVAPVHHQGCDVCDESSGVKALGDSQVVSTFA